MRRGLAWNRWEKPTGQGMKTTLTMRRNALRTHSEVQPKEQDGATKQLLGITSIKLTLEQLTLSNEAKRNTREGGNGGRDGQ